MVEAERRAFADRCRIYGRPRFIEDKTKMLISEEYLKNRWKNFSFEKPLQVQKLEKLLLNLKESTETTYISIIDKFGNAVAVTTTLNGLYGSKVVVKGGGYF